MCISEEGIPTSQRGQIMQKSQKVHIKCISIRLVFWNTIRKIKDKIIKPFPLHKIKLTKEDREERSKLKQINAINKVAILGQELLPITHKKPLIIILYANSLNSPKRQSSKAD